MYRKVMLFVVGLAFLLPHLLFISDVYAKPRSQLYGLSCSTYIESRKAGVPFQIVVEAYLPCQANKASLDVHLPAGVELISGNLHWKGVITSEGNCEHRESLLLQINNPGIYRINYYFNASGLQSDYYTYEDPINLRGVEYFYVDKDTIVLEPNREMIEQKIRDSLYLPREQIDARRHAKSEREHWEQEAERKKNLSKTRFNTETHGDMKIPVSAMCADLATISFPTTSYLTLPEIFPDSNLYVRQLRQTFEQLSNDEIQRLKKNPTLRPIPPDLHILDNLIRNNSKYSRLKHVSPDNISEIALLLHQQFMQLAVIDRKLASTSDSVEYVRLYQEREKLLLEQHRVMEHTISKSK
ncbi:MAG: hypothetical protein OEM52_01385 [bacterium]|nr:hypothetical protein [bacterium]